MVTRQDYSANAVEAARSVLLELAHLLSAYGDDIVVVGGWVPDLLLPAGRDLHVGSIDVDLAVNHRTLEEPRYQRLKQRLLERGYKQDDKQPFRFYRTVSVKDRPIQVEVDFLAGEYEGTGKRHRTQHFEDLRARKARGCELALEINTSVRIHGTLPSGGQDQADISVASAVPFLVMKGMALYERLKEKDAWDIYFTLKNYPGGLDALASEFSPYLGNGLVQEGLYKIAEKFASVEHVGPKFVADFDEIADSDERERVQRDAFERVDYLLGKLGVKLI